MTDLGSISCAKCGLELSAPHVLIKSYRCHVCRNAFCGDCASSALGSRYQCPFCGPVKPKPSEDAGSLTSQPKARMEYPEWARPKLGFWGLMLWLSSIPLMEFSLRSWGGSWAEGTWLKVIGIQVSFLMIGVPLAFLAYGYLFNERRGTGMLSYGVLAIVLALILLVF